MARPASPRTSARSVSGVLVLAVVAAALSAIAGGLLRAGVPMPPSRWLGAAALDHAALMIGAFMGTVIGVERAVALGRRLAWLAPAASAAGGLALLVSWRAAGAVLLVLAAAQFVIVNAHLVRRQRAPHTWLLLASAWAWLAGNALHAVDAPVQAVLPWWFGFLVVTIAAERLEMTRLMPRRPGAQATLYATLVLLGAGGLLSLLDAAAGALAYGAALALLAAWLMAFDIARRTLRTGGLSRYMAVCLLGGYAWLAVAGLAWAATGWGWPLRDVALHALGLGFIVSMMMGHAPVILPAVTGIRLRFSLLFYLPLSALHLSLLWRLAAPLAGGSGLARGAQLNAAAIALFALVAFAAARAGRRRAAA